MSIKPFTECFCTDLELESSVPYFYLSSLKKVFVFRTNTIEFFGEENAVVGRFVAGGLTCRTIPDG
jgi:hypothetical protein